MPTSFFTGWKLWEQLTFCLACGLVLAISIGLLKLTYTSWRVRKYSALDKLVRKTSILREKSIMRTLSKKPKQSPKTQPSADTQPKPSQRPEVFFGIKALEKGAIVEGVWTSSKTSRVLLGDGKPESYAKLSDLEAQPIRSTLAYTQARNLDSPPNVLPVPLLADAARPARNTRAYPPHSFARYDAEDLKSTARRSSSRNRKSRESYRQACRTSSVVSRQSDADDSLRSLPISRDSSANSIQLIDAHRASVCAETGQILPRFRSTSISHKTDEPAGAPVNLDETTLVDDLPSADISDASLQLAPITISTDTASNTRQALVTSSPDETSALPVVATGHSTLMHQSSFTRPDHNKDAEVLRRVNSGFAILRPGTLNVNAQPLGQATDLTTLQTALLRSRSHSAARRRSWRQSLERRLSSSSSANKGLGVSASRSQRLQKRRPSDEPVLIKRPSI